MATTFSSVGQSTNSHHRTVERVLEEAQHTGEINLSGRKLREYPKISSKYDLVDTSAADLSKNRLNEIPQEICEYHSMERLNCYHNVIKMLPEALVQLQNLTHLCISRNQLTVIPAFIKHLNALEVFIASHNRLVSLPEEIGELKRLMEIDVSCNEISHLPLQIGDLKSLRSLNVRRNLLIELPVEISKLNLRKFDFSSNKISTIPTIFRKIETLEEFILDHNPLTSPPAFICTRGKQHIMKYLQLEAIKEDRKRGILNESEMKRLVRKSLPPQNSISSEEFRNIMDNSSPENRWKRHTVLSSDSGYSTTDSIEKCGWSPSEVVTNGDLDDHMTHKTGPVVMRDLHHNVRDVEVPRRTVDNRPPPINTAYSGDNASHYANSLSPKTPTQSQYQHPAIYSDNESGHMTYPSSPQSPLSPQTPVTPKFPIVDRTPPTNEDEFTRELQRQKNEYERKKKYAEQLRIQQEDEEKEKRRLAAQRIQDEQKAVLEKQREEFRAQEEARILQENRRLEEAREIEEQRQREELRLREEQRLQEEERQREEARLAEEQRQREDAKRQSETKTKRPAINGTMNNVRSNHYYYQSWQTSDRYSPGYIPSSHNNLSPGYPGYTSSNAAPSQRGQSQVPMGHSMGQSRYPPSSPGYSPSQGSYTPESPGYSPGQGYSPVQSGYSPGTPGYSPGYSPGSSAGSLYSPTGHGPHSPGYNNQSQMSGDPNYRPVGQSPGYNRHTTQNDQNMMDTYSMQYRKPVQSSQSFTGEDKKSNSTQYRRTVSDTSKKSQPSNSSTNRPTQAKHTPGRSIPVLQRKTPSGTVNGKSPASPGMSPSPSPRSSVGSTGPSPASSTSSLHKAGGTTNAVVRRNKVTDRMASSPVTNGRSLPGSERHGRPSTSSSTTGPTGARTATANSTNSTTKKNHLTPEEEFRQKHQTVKNSPLAGRGEESRLKQTQKDAINSYVARKSTPSTPDEEKKRPTTSASRTSNYNSRRSGAVMSNSTMKVIDSYKEAEPGYNTIRRQEERYREEAEQLDRLRKTIESKLKVTLPDNLPETLRDGVLLCQLANSLRPRAVTSIHVPSPAVPKLTQAKCRKNVENFLEACRKIGVGRDQICGPQDILEEKGIGRVAVTISSLVASTSGPKGSNV